MSSNFNFTVDTNPMASSMESVSRNVKGTTAAVVAMQTAVVLSQNKAANKVCDNVNRGFYTLIHSTITQKVVKLKSEVDSLYLKLEHQRKQLVDLQARMGRDYSMLLRRYDKLFDTLNRSLRQRIFELEKPLIAFCVKDMERVSNRPLHLTSTVPLMQGEALTLSQKMLISNFKNECRESLDVMARFLEQMKEQVALTDRILLNMPMRRDNAVHCVPVIITESNFDNSRAKHLQIEGNSQWLRKRDIESVRTQVVDSHGGLEWAPAQLDPEVKSEFSKLLSSSSASKRVKDMAMRLLDAANCETIKTAKR